MVYPRKANIKRNKTVRASKTTVRHRDRNCFATFVDHSLVRFALRPMNFSICGGGTAVADGWYPRRRRLLRKSSCPMSGRGHHETRDLCLLAQRRSLSNGRCGNECPYVPGLEREDWPLLDPKNRPLAEVRQIRDEIRDRVAALI